MFSSGTAQWIIYVSIELGSEREGIVLFRPVIGVALLPSGHIGGKGGQDQYEWWCRVTDPMAVVINTIIDHQDHDQDQHHD